MTPRMRPALGVLALVVALLGATPALGADTAPGPYRQPLKPRGMTLQAVTLPPRTIGTHVVRAHPALAVAINVAVADYLPRGLEPTLLIDGMPVRTSSGVSGVQGPVTTLTFLVEDPALLKDGARVALQMDRDPKTRVDVPGVLRRNAIRPPDPAELQRLGLPTLSEWLSGRGAR